jgi:hypothetical protein
MSNTNNNECNAPAQFFGNECNAPAQFFENESLKLNHPLLFREPTFLEKIGINDFEIEMVAHDYGDDEERFTASCTCTLLQNINKNGDYQRLYRGFSQINFADEDGNYSSSVLIDAALNASFDAISNYMQEKLNVPSHRVIYNGSSEISASCLQHNENYDSE